MTESEKYAYTCGIAFAEQLNRTPRELQNWSALLSTDTIPDGDYVDMKKKFGAVTTEMGYEYRRGFNETADFDDRDEPSS